MPAGTNATKMAAMIDPEVMGQMISAKLPKAIRFMPLAMVGTDLQGRPGTTLTLPKYAYIGDATDVAEGADIPISKLATSKTTVTIKKVGIGIELTDESILSGYGKPLDEGVGQLAMSIANKVDNDCLTALKASTLVYTTLAGGLTDKEVIKAKAKFGEHVTENAVLMVNSSNYTKLTLSPSWIANTESGANIMKSGVLGFIGGCEVIVSDKLIDTEAFIVRAEALEIQLKRNVEVETDRDIVAKCTVVTADEHYVAYLKDDSKAIKVTITA
ncbi:MAG: N4-gp56 family major capsid protein [Christensenellaceae bacterium]